MLLLFLALLSTTAYAADKCCGPIQWHGGMGMVMAMINNGTTTLVEGTMTVAYDGVNEIAGYNQSLMVNGKPVRQRIIQDDKNKVMYMITITGDSESCIRTRLGSTLQNCVPSNATETTPHIVYGLGVNSVSVKAYHVHYDKMDVYMAVTTDTCVPVTMVYTGKLLDFPFVDPNTDVMQTLTFVNMKPGIANSDIFLVPAQCQQAPNPVGKRSFLFQ